MDRRIAPEQPTLDAPRAEVREIFDRALQRLNSVFERHECGDASDNEFLAATRLKAEHAAAVFPPAA